MQSEPTRPPAATDEQWRQILAHLRTIPALRMARPDSVDDAIARAVANDVPLDNRDGWLEVRETGPASARYHVAVLRTGYRYTLRRLYTLGAAKVEACLVYQGETIRWNGARCILHESDPFGAPDRPVVGVWARITWGDGREFDAAVTRAELDQIAKGSKSPAWKEWFGEMAKKTAVARGAKLTPVCLDLPDTPVAPVAAPVSQLDRLRATPALDPVPVTDDEAAPDINTEEF
jgi:recombinational DNA repair protein RecT